MSQQARQFTAVDAVRGQEPLLLGMIGPPGGGKTFSALRLAKGMQSVRGGDIVVIDTECGRSRKYAGTGPGQFKFRIAPFDPPFLPHEFLSAIRQQLPSKPAAIIVDSLSDEHEGEGGYLEWHDEEVPKFGGNGWAAWSKPKASRKRLITGLLHINTPLIFTFRAREKTRETTDADRGGKKVIVKDGWSPVAPLEIVHALDLTCILPPRADGKPIWKSDKLGEEFVIKLPLQFQSILGQADRPITEDIGRQLAIWASGGSIDPLEAGRIAAASGTEALKSWWTGLASKTTALKAALDGELKAAAAAADARPNAAPTAQQFALQLEECDDVGNIDPLVEMIGKSNLTDAEKEKLFALASERRADLELK